MSRCPICGGDARPWISCPIDQKTGRRTKHGSTILCSACDIGSVFPQPDRSEIPAFYELDRYYTQGESHFAKARATFADRVLVNLAWRLDRGREITAQTITSRFGRAGSACDIGAGRGHILGELARIGWSVVGVEPDPKARVLLESQGLPAYAGTAESLPEPLRDKRFDLVIMSHTLEHCLDPVAAIKNAAALLSRATRASRLLIEVPNKDCVHFRTFGAVSECFDVPRHLFFFGSSSLRRLVEYCGLRVDEEYQHGLTRHHLPDWRATERRIRDQVRSTGGDAPNHTFLASTALLAQELLSPKSQRYDTAGLWAAF